MSDYVSREPPCGWLKLQSLFIQKSAYLITNVDWDNETVNFESLAQIVDYGKRALSQFLSLDLIFRVITIGFLILLLSVLILRQLPTYISAAFNIFSQQVSFIISSNNKTSHIFNSTTKLKSIRINNVKYLELNVQKMEIENFDYNEHIGGELLIKPSGVATNLDIDILNDSSDYFRLKKLTLPKEMELGFQKQNSTLVIRYGKGKNSGKKQNNLKSTLIILGTIKLNLKRCKILQDGDEIFNNISIDKEYSSIITPIAGKHNINFEGIDESTRLEIDLGEEINKEPIILFKDVKGKLFNIYDQSLFISEGIKKSTISNEIVSSIIIQFEEPKPIELKEDEIFKIKPSKFPDFNLDLNKIGLKSKFNAKIRYLKTGEPNAFRTARNLIPNCLKWITVHSKTSWIIILMFAAFIGYIISILAERLY